MDKTERFGMVLTPQEKEQLEMLAWRRRVSTSELVRLWIAEAVAADMAAQPCEEVRA
ncbi:MAG: hypothetical protein WC651_03315 [Candidatus Gracilibacteria bacterium]|jgi:hypothetical protein